MAKEYIFKNEKHDVYVRIFESESGRKGWASESNFPEIALLQELERDLVISAINKHDLDDENICGDIPELIGNMIDEANTNLKNSAVMFFKTK